MPQTARDPREIFLLRTRICESDRDRVREILDSTGFFNSAEVQMGVELAEDRLRRGERSDYQFLFADLGEQVLGYTCFGRIAGAQERYDLYWIAVHQRHRARGLGRWLLGESENRIAAMGGRRVYVETSARPLYEPTRAFYLACGYKIGAVIDEFYAKGDSKVVFCKILAAD